MNPESLLDAVSEDAMRELVNIGMGHAGAAISEVTGREIFIDSPVVEVLSSFQGRQLPELQHRVAVRVSMSFAGGLNGHALLVLSREGASRLVEILVGSTPQQALLDESAQSALLEIGNILLNRVVGLLLNEIGGAVEYQLPRLQLRGIEAMIDLFSDLQKDADAGGMLIQAALRVDREGIFGYVLLILSPSELRVLVGHITRLAKRPR